MDIAYDVEVFPNIFTIAAECCDAPFQWSFEISDWQDDNAKIIEWVRWMRERGHRMVGFNNIGFDYSLIHMLCRAGGSTADLLYQKAQAIIRTQDDDEQNKWVHQVYPSDRIVEQIDLYKIHHFDNNARRTSLKALQFNMRSESVMAMPIELGSRVTLEQRPILHRYNQHDVSETKKFYHRSLPMIAFREELTRKYKRDFMNHNDTKIGKDYFVMQLEQAGIPCYDYDPETGRTPRQTRRPVIHLRDAVLPWIKFDSTEFKRVLDWVKNQSITETKGVFKDLTARFAGLDFVFGTGGIHASVENKHIESDDEYVIVDLDVSSYYPNLAIHNKFYPAHLGPRFCDIYQQLYEQRKNFPKGTPENAMLKLALNGVYGDSNNKFSVFYDPLFTMSITLNGQFLLCLLAEMLDMYLEALQIIQCNTDGITIRLPRRRIGAVDVACEHWQKQTGMALERVEYKSMSIRDVNNYIAVGVDGKVKRKGAYEYKREWHQDHSMLVIPKVAEKALVEGVSIRETVANWPEPLDFMGRIRVNKGSYLAAEDESGMHLLQNTCRYYVSTHGVMLWKWMPPLKKNPTEWRKIGVEAGQVVQLCNDLQDGKPLIPHFDYYVHEVEKLVLGIA